MKEFGDIVRTRRRKGSCTRNLRRVSEDQKRLPVVADISFAELMIFLARIRRTRPQMNGYLTHNNSQRWQGPILVPENERACLFLEHMRRTMKRPICKDTRGKKLVRGRTMIQRHFEETILILRGLRARLVWCKVAGLGYQVLGFGI